jgi:hypothetical protein
MAQQLALGGHPIGFAATTRSDRWWVGALLTLLGLLGFVAYATWAAFQGDHYYYAPYVSPFYSPLLFVDTRAAGAAPIGHALFGAWPSWWPRGVPASPSFLIVAFPFAFRFTCYYFRRAYYRAFVATPPACAVGGLPRRDYRGETSLLVFQNLHRYALYFIMVFIAVHYYDTFWAYFREGQFGVGVGSIVLTLDAALLTAYVFGCHSFRHLVGGGLDCFSCDAGASLRHGFWAKVSVLNGRHGLFAWLSLFWVAFSDLYVRLVSMGVVHDMSTWR